MDNFKVLAADFFLIGIPECIALTLLTLVLLKQKPDWAKVLLISIITSLVVFVLRAANLDIGLHTAIAVITLALLVNYFFNISRLNSLIAGLIAMLSLVIAEYLVFFLIGCFFALDINILAQNKLYWYLSNWLHIFLLLIISLLLTLFFKYIKNHY